MRKTELPDHHRERNKQRKTKPQAIHHHHPPGTKFKRKILHNTYTKAKTLQLLGLAKSFPEISPNVETNAGK